MRHKISSDTKNKPEGERRNCQEVCWTAQNGNLTDKVGSLLKEGQKPPLERASFSIPGQGAYRRQPISVSLSHQRLCFPLSLSPLLPPSLSPSFTKINKHILG